MRIIGGMLRYPEGLRCWGVDDGPGFGIINLTFIPMTFSFFCKQHCCCLVASGSV